MNRLKFNIVERINSPTLKTVQILVDDQDLLDLIGARANFANLAPFELHDFLHETSSYLDLEYHVNLMDDEYKTIIYCCSCGYFECDRLIVEIVFTDNSVIWRDFTVESLVPFSYSGSFEFTKANYDECLSVLAQYMENKKK